MPFYTKLFLGVLARRFYIKRHKWHSLPSPLGVACLFLWSLYPPFGIGLSAHEDGFHGWWLWSWWRFPWSCIIDKNPSMVVVPWPCWSLMCPASAVVAVVVIQLHGWQINGHSPLLILAVMVTRYRCAQAKKWRGLILSNLNPDSWQKRSPADDGRA